MKHFFKHEYRHAVSNPYDKSKPLSFTLASALHGVQLKTLEDHMHMAFCKDCSRKAHCKIEPQVSADGKTKLCRGMEVRLSK